MTELSISKITYIILDAQSTSF